MAVLSYPLSLEGFFLGLRVSSLSFDLSENMNMSETGGGELLMSDLGPRLWQGQVEVTPGYHDDQRKVRAVAQTLRQAGRSFFVTDLAGQYPQSDPDGAALGASNVTINSLNANNRQLSLAGLPAGYVITAGDYLSFAYGSAPTRYAFHQVVQGGQAGGTGITPLLEVAPFIRPGAVVGAEVILARPYFKAVVIPGSFTTGAHRHLITEGFSFSFRQTHR